MSWSAGADALPDSLRGVSDLSESEAVAAFLSALREGRTGCVTLTAVQDDDADLGADDAKLETPSPHLQLQPPRGSEEDPLFPHPPGSLSHVLAAAAAARAPTTQLDMTESDIGAAARVQRRAEVVAAPAEPWVSPPKPDPVSVRTAFTPLSPLSSDASAADTVAASRVVSYDDDADDAEFCSLDGGDDDESAEASSFMDLDPAPVGAAAATGSTTTFTPLPASPPAPPAVVAVDVAAVPPVPKQQRRQPAAAVAAPQRQPRRRSAAPPAVARRVAAEEAHTGNWQEIAADDETAGGGARAPPPPSAARRSLAARDPNVVHRRAAKRAPSASAGTCSSEAAPARRKTPVVTCRLPAQHPTRVLPSVAPVGLPGRHRIAPFRPPPAC